jgi:hypothetical protein
LQYGGENGKSNPDPKQLSKMLTSGNLSIVCRISRWWKCSDTPCTFKQHLLKMLMRRTYFSIAISLFQYWVASGFTNGVRDLIVSRQDLASRRSLSLQDPIEELGALFNAVTLGGSTDDIVSFLNNVALSQRAPLRKWKRSKRPLIVDIAEGSRWRLVIHVLPSGTFLDIPALLHGQSIITKCIHGVVEATESKRGGGKVGIPSTASFGGKDGGWCTCFGQVDCSRVSCEWREFADGKRRGIGAASSTILDSPEVGTRASATANIFSHRSGGDGVTLGYQLSTLSDNDEASAVLLEVSWSENPSGGGGGGGGADVVEAPYREAPFAMRWMMPTKDLLVRQAAGPEGPSRDEVDLPRRAEDIAAADRELGKLVPAAAVSDPLLARPPPSVGLPADTTELRPPPPPPQVSVDSGVVG